MSEKTIIHCPHCRNRILLEFVQPALTLYVSKADPVKNEDLK